MQLTTLFLAALTGASLSAAAPAAAAAAAGAHDKRACTRVFPIGTTSIHLAKSGGSNTAQNIGFSIPANAGGPCSLVATFPAGYPIASTGNPQVNVIDLNGPAAGSIVGTVTFASDPGAPTLRTINSFACRPDMQYRLTLAGTAGTVDFAVGNGAGVAMTYSC